jgi:hypothetical protein
VLGIEKSLEEGELKPGTELFVFTDNSTSERAFNNGTSKSKTLHALVLWLRKLQMQGKLFINFVWISGDRMIEQGTDSLSRGGFDKWKHGRRQLSQTHPLNESAPERNPMLMPCLMEALPRKR